MDYKNLPNAVRCLKALSHPIRLGILCSLKDGELPVLTLADKLGTTQSNISQHLASMRERDILVTERRANQVFYRVRDDRMFQLLDVLQQIYCAPNPNDDNE